MKIIVKEQFSFKEIFADEGKYLTTYNEGDDIKTYSASRQIIAPISYDESVLKEITEEEHNELQAAYDAAMTEEMNREREERE